MQATNEKPITQRKHSRPAAGRGTHGRFPVGVSGNPAGRPEGSRHRASVLAEGLLDGRVEALTEKAVEMALAGDVTALRLCLERLLPVRRERHLTMTLPSPVTAAEITAGFVRVVEALASGDLTPSETSSVAELLESARRAIETTDLARRIEELEDRLEDGEQDEVGADNWPAE